MTVNAVSVVWFLFRNVYGLKLGLGRLPSAPGPIGVPIGVPSWTPPLGQGVVLVLVSLALVCGVGAVWAFRAEPVSAEKAPH
jgi:hypothetical protein